MVIINLPHQSWGLTLPISSIWFVVIAILLNHAFCLASGMPLPLLSFLASKAILFQLLLLNFFLPSQLLITGVPRTQSSALFSHVYPDFLCNFIQSFDFKCCSYADDPKRISLALTFSLNSKLSNQIAYSATPFGYVVGIPNVMCPHETLSFPNLLFLQPSQPQMEPLHLSSFSGLTPFYFTLQPISKSTGSTWDYTQYLVCTSGILCSSSIIFLLSCCHKGVSDPLHPPCSIIVFISYGIQRHHLSGQNPPMPSPHWE